MATKEWVAKNQDRMKAYRRVYYARNRASEQARIYKRAEEIRAWFDGYRATLSCSRCPESHAACLDFHHRDGVEKDGNIGMMVRAGCSVARVKKEMLKCDVLCSNCHRKLHFDLRNTPLM